MDYDSGHNINIINSAYRRALRPRKEDLQCQYGYILTKYHLINLLYLPDEVLSIIYGLVIAANYHTVYY